MNDRQESDRPWIRLHRRGVQRYIRTVRMRGPRGLQAAPASERVRRGSALASIHIAYQLDHITLLHAYKSTILIR